MISNQFLTNQNFTMKTYFIFLCTIFLTIASQAQTIKNPLKGLSTVRGLTITSIEKTDSTTTLFFQFKMNPGVTFMIPKETYIQPFGSDKKLFLKTTNNVPVGSWNPIPDSGETAYSIVFPAVSDTVARIDYGEANEGGSWFIYDIYLKAPADLSMVPEWLNGNWYKQGTSEWAISFLDSVAVFQNAVWKYDQIQLKKQSGNITVRKGEQKIELKIKAGKNGLCEIALGNEATKSFSKVPQCNRNIIEPGLEPIKIQADTCILSGYIPNYSPRYGVNTFMVYLNDVLIGDQITNTVTIQPDGTFSSKIPMIHPQSAYCQSNFFGNTLFLEPGKELFILSAPGQEPLFMGEPARVNKEMIRLQKIQSSDYNKKIEKLLNSSATEYKAFILQKKQSELQALADSADNGCFSPKTIDVVRESIIYRNAGDILGYNMDFESAYRNANKIPYTDRNAVIPADTLSAEYFDFLTPEFVNNPQALSTAEFYFFINRLMYLRELRDEPISFSSNDCYRQMLKEKYPFTDSERETLGVILATDSIQKLPSIVEFNKKYQKQAMAFSQKYQRELQEFSKNHLNKQWTITDFADSLKNSGTVFTEEEAQYISAQKIYSESPEVNQIAKILNSKNDSIQAFNTRYNKFLNSYFSKFVRENRNNRLKEKFGITKGLATDIMISQEFCRGIVSEITPVSGEELAEMQKQFTNPEAANYLKVCNEATIAKIALNKTRSGYSVNETPQNAGDKLFEAIMSKYKGKVVYVDFWATWCGPCRSGIERIKPLKEDMKNENVVFVYITGPSSPQNTWENMIADIKGEHYRVSADEWNYLCSKFNISGIPHCTLVDKEGNVVNPSLGFQNNDYIKTLLMKYL